MKKYITSLILIFIFMFITFITSNNDYITEERVKTSQSYENYNNISGCITKITEKENNAVPKTIDFSKFDFDKIDSIFITSGITGYTVCINDNKIYDIIEFIKKITGDNPTSSKGYYGFLFHIKLMEGEKLNFEITFTGENLPGENAFNFGIYEVIGKFKYPVRYNTDDVTEKDILDMFSPYFVNVNK